MGVLNITPDSFSDGGQFLDPADLQRRQMGQQGRGIIDVGAEASSFFARESCPWTRRSSFGGWFR